MTSFFEEPIARSNRIQSDPKMDSRYALVDVRFAGDVQHIFSHIKKTYKVQKIRVRGGTVPPSVRPHEDTVDPSGRKRETTKSGTGSASTSIKPIWVPVDKVPAAK